ncbi:MAG: nucleotidyltransferase substrate binding protein [Candidatus Pacebacteria bacterium]|nr:nucleotidyltransferase substrate binding protein [Candidatus Paceibacterota bacterium]
MTEKREPRWVLRLENFQNSVRNLMAARELSKTRDLTDLEKQGLIHGFILCYELSWNLIKDYLEYAGHGDILGSRFAFRLALKQGLLINGEVWINMIKDRNLASHTYNPALVGGLIDKIINVYSPEFNWLINRIQTYNDSQK